MFWIIFYFKKSYKTKNINYNIAQWSVLYNYFLFCLKVIIGFHLIMAKNHNKIKCHVCSLCLYQFYVLSVITRLSWLILSDLLIFQYYGLWSQWNMPWCLKENRFSVISKQNCTMAVDSSALVTFLKNLGLLWSH